MTSAVETTVAIVGAGASGLTLAALLHRAGVDYVVLEARSRSYVEERQRAGVLDHYAGQVYVKAGLTEPILGGAPTDSLLEIRYDGVARFLNIPELAGGRHSYVVPQQLLVRRLIALLVDGAADVRFEAAGSRCPLSLCAQRRPHDRLRQHFPRKCCFPTI
ncbi:MAG TPA: FAD-dependent monooxygenase [Candidatus Limnocylindrales bacterium]|nr:FAD-dependent monooxygenase [Candidatus Limnocylindrales bacterium]